METLFVGKNIIKLSTVDSTNNYANMLLRQSVINEGDVVITDHQTAGKGQRGNSWETIPNCNLTFSVLLSPRFLNVQNQFYLTKSIALAIAIVLEAYLDGFVEVKWPNDIYVNGKKIAGILIETSISGAKINSAIVGVGLNVNQAEFDKSIHATSLIIESKARYDLKKVLNDLLFSIETNYLKLRKNHLCFDDKYISKLRGYKEMRDFLVNGVKVSGEICGVNKLGQLRVVIHGVEKVFNMQEIAFID
jgi:BirA family biotin operon repressor/biotin-[acetyl-CoA-carboxylase] ligase